MEITFYKLASGSFSLAYYTRKDGYPDVQRDRELIDDATFYIAKEMRKEGRNPGDAPVCGWVEVYQARWQIRNYAPRGVSDHRGGDRPGLYSCRPVKGS